MSDYDREELYPNEEIIIEDGRTSPFDYYVMMDMEKFYMTKYVGYKPVCVVLGIDEYDKVIKGKDGSGKIERISKILGISVDETFREYIIAALGTLIIPNGVEFDYSSVNINNLKEHNIDRLTQTAQAIRDYDGEIEIGAPDLTILLNYIYTEEPDELSFDIIKREPGIDNMYDGIISLLRANEIEEEAAKKGEV